MKHINEQIPEENLHDHMVDAFRYMAMVSGEHVETRWEKFLRHCRTVWRKIRPYIYEWVDEGGTVKRWMGLADMGWRRRQSLMIVVPFHLVYAYSKKFSEWMRFNHPYSCNQCMEMERESLNERLIRNEEMRVMRQAFLDATEALNKDRALLKLIENDCSCPQCSAHD